MLTVSYVRALPAQETRTASTIYLVVPEGSTDAGDLSIYITGTDAAVVHHAPTLAEISQLVQSSVDNGGQALQNAVDTLTLEISQGDIDTLAAAKVYTDGRETAIRADMATAVGDAQTAAQSYADTLVQNLDMSNSAVFAATYADMVALELTKNSFVMVSDATDDPSGLVAAGAALYFYNLATTTYTKIAEYENMDVMIPNLDILADLSDIDGQLGYKGSLVATVQLGETAW